MEEYKRKRQEELGIPVPQEEPADDPESVDPFTRPAKGKKVANGKVEKGKKLKKDKKSKRSRKLKGNDDELVEVNGPDMVTPVQPKKSKSKGKYDMDQYNPVEAYAPSP